MTDKAKVTQLHPAGQDNKQQQGSFDPWSTESGAAYDLDRVYTRSVNKHDHSINIQTPVPKDIAGRIDELVQSGKIPTYKGRQDFVRDALVHRLHYVCNEKQMMLEAGDDIQAEMQACYLQQRRSRLAKWKSNIEDARELLTDLRMAGDDAGFQHEQERILDIAETMPEPYRTQMRAVTGN